jgi:hypothetical protein
MRNIESAESSLLYSSNKDLDGALKLKYSNRTRILKIFHEPTQSTVLEISFAGRSGFTSDAINTYICLFKKATETHALVFSNNETLHIADIIDLQKLPAILEYAAEISFLALEIEQGCYKKFAARIKHDFTLKEMCLRKVTSAHYKRGHFKARVKLINEKHVMIRACKPHSALKELSQKVIHELVAHEYTNNNEKRASQLMTLASRLAFIAKIIDPKFLPEKQLS